MRENAYQATLIKELRLRFPGCFILKNDSSYLQGIPDLLLLIGDRWFILEVKASEDEPYRPNQEYYLDILDRMSYATTIYPENEDEVLDEIQRQLETSRKARVSKRK